MNPNQSNIYVRYRTLLILWFAISMSILTFVAIVQFVPVDVTGNRQFSLLLNCAGIVPLGVSFLLKSQLLNKATQKQRLDQVQAAYVVAFALSEAAALLGVLDHFVNGPAYYYVGFIFAGLGMLLHFPQKKHLLAAAGQEF